MSTHASDDRGRDPAAEYARLFGPLPEPDDDGAEPALAEIAAAGPRLARPPGWRRFVVRAGPEGEGDAPSYRVRDNLTGRVLAWGRCRATLEATAAALEADHDAGRVEPAPLDGWGASDGPLALAAALEARGGTRGGSGDDDDEGEGHALVPPGVPCDAEGWPLLRFAPAAGADADGPGGLSLAALVARHDMLVALASAARGGPGRSAARADLTAVRDELARRVEQLARGRGAVGEDGRCAAVFAGRAWCVLPAAVSAMRRRSLMAFPAAVLGDEDDTTGGGSR